MYVYTVLVDDACVPHVASVHTDRDDALRAASTAIDSVVSEHAHLGLTRTSFAPDDASTFIDAVEFSQSATVISSIKKELLVGVIVQRVDVLTQ